MATEIYTAEWLRQQKINKKGRVVLNESPSPKVSGPIAGDNQPEGQREAKYKNVKVPDPENPAKPFDSKLEAKHAKEYRLMAKIGEIITVTRQPKFHLPGGICYIADFHLLHNDLSVEIVDSKGVLTPEFVMKRKLFEEKFPSLKLTVRHK